jgi:hypothetical protein
MGNAVCASEAARPRSCALAEKNCGSNGEPVAGFIPANPTPAPTPSPNPINDTVFNPNASSISVFCVVLLMKFATGKMQLQD